MASIINKHHIRSYINQYSYQITLYSLASIQGNSQNISRAILLS